MVGEKGVEFDAEEGNFLVQAADEQGVIEILQLFGGKVLGIEAVLAGVLVAGLGAALAIAGDVVEGALGWGVRAGEGFEEGFDCIHGRRVAGGWTGRQGGHVRGGGDAFVGELYIKVNRLSTKWVDTQFVNNGSDDDDAYDFKYECNHDYVRV